MAIARNADGTTGTSRGSDSAADSVETISDLKAYTGSSDTVIVQGYYTAGDSGGGEFYWDATSTDTDNGGTIIQATGVTTGRWKSTTPDQIFLRKFGAKGDGVTDDTTFIQAACDYADNYYPGSDQATYGLQSIPVNFGAGKFLITDTISYIGAGHWMMRGGDGRSSSLITNFTTSKPAIHCTNGANFRFEELQTLTISGSTDPSHWIKIDLAIDIGFSVKGTSFGNCGDATIECTGVTNAYLNDWRVDNTENTVLRVNCTGGASFYRNIIFDDFTCHNRAGASNATSVIEMVDFQTSDSYNIGFRNCRFEIEDDPVTYPSSPGIGADWSYVDVNATGTLTASPHIRVSFENVHAQYNGGGTGKDSNIIKATSATTAIRPILSFDGAIFDELTDYANGDIDTTFTQPLATDFNNYQLSGYLDSGKHLDLFTKQNEYDLNNRFFIHEAKDLTDSTNNDIFNIELPTESQAGGVFSWTIEATDGTDFQSLTNVTYWTATNKAGAKASTATTNTNNESKNVTTGTLTATISVASSASGVKLRINPVSSLTTTSYKAYYTITNNSGQTITKL